MTRLDSESHYCQIKDCPYEPVVQLVLIEDPATTIWSCRKHRSMFLTRPFGTFDPTWKEVTSC